MRKRWILAITALVLLLAVTACGTPDATTGGAGPTATPEPSPSATPEPFSDPRYMVDYSTDKSLTDDLKTTLLQAWDVYITTVEEDYVLEGDFAYYGTFNGHSVIYVPITNNGADDIDMATGYNGNGSKRMFVYGYNRLVTYWTAYAGEWFLGQEMTDSIYRQHYAYCEEELGYDFQIDSPIPSDDIRAEIDAALVRTGTHGEGLSWGPTDEGIWLDDYGVIYFGEYNEYHLFFAEQISGADLTYLTIRSSTEAYTFNVGTKYIAYGYKDGVLYYANDLLEQGEITSQNVAEMQIICYVYGLHCHRSVVK